MSLLVTNIPWSENAKPHKHIARRLRCKPSDIVEAVCLKRSVDARRRPPVWFANYKVTLSIDEAPILKRTPHGTRPFTARDAKRYAKVVHVFLDESLRYTQISPDLIEDLVLGQEAVRIVNE